MDLKRYIGDGAEAVAAQMALAGLDETGGGRAERVAVLKRIEELQRRRNQSCRIVADGDYREDHRYQHGIEEGLRWVLELRETARTADTQRKQTGE
ncbi:MAG: hypothetical protein NTY53_24080 [Kiritimatiellaeota bacterium]|nr:hypothetical protein [Kiritimatiellota bacterium]